MQENSHLFEAIKIIAASYLRADNGAIADSIQRYGLNDLLYGVARLELSLRPPTGVRMAFGRDEATPAR